jgi:hypothetical protein
MKRKLLLLKIRVLNRIAGLMLILAIPFSTYQSNAQCWQWAVNFGGTSLETPTSMSVGPDGLTAITGEFMGTAIIGNDTLVAATGRDVFTVLLDSNGIVLKAMDGVGDGVENIGNGIASDANGNIFITGNFSETIMFDDVPLVSAGLGDIFIVKYDASGNLLWAKRAGGGSNIYAHDIAVDPAGNCHIIGEFYDSASFDNHGVLSTTALDVFTAKYDPDGNALWAASCGSVSSDVGNGIAVDNLSNVYITGYFQGEFIFNSIPYNTLGNRDGFIAKYDAAGNPLWATVGGGWNNEFFNKIAVDGAGDNIYVTGEFESDSIFVDALTLVNKNSNGIRRDVLLMNLNSAGATQWGIRAGSIEHDYANDVTIDDTGDVYITGIFDDTIVFENTTLINDNGDFYIAKYNNSGTGLWAISSTFNSADAASSSVGTYKNRPLITGDFVAGPAPPIVVFDNDTIISNGSLDVFVAKIGPPCNTISTGVENHIGIALSWDVFPNPFNDRLNIQVDDNAQGSIDLKLYNLHGGLIFSDRYSGYENISLSTDHLPSGVYFLQVRSGGTIQSVKMVKF